MVSPQNRGIDWMWFSRDYKKLLAHCAGAPSPKMYKAEEYIQVDLKKVKYGKINPGDKDWDNYDFFSKVNFFIAGAKSEDQQYASEKSGMSFTFKQLGGKGGWPALVVGDGNGLGKTVTDGMNRILAARWSASGKAIVFIQSESGADCDPFCRGRIFTADPVSGDIKPITKSMFRADVLLNMSAAKDFLVFHDDGGVFSYDFASPPKVLDPDGTEPLLFESK
jgi:hypothetical protein